MIRTLFLALTLGLSLAPFGFAQEAQLQGFGVKVAQGESGKLVVRYGPAFTGDLEHWRYDTFQAAWRDCRLGKSLVTFTLKH